MSMVWIDNWEGAPTKILSIRELASSPTIGHDLCVYNTQCDWLTDSALLSYTYR